MSSHDNSKIAFGANEMQIDSYPGYLDREYRALRVRRDRAGANQPARAA